MLNFKHIPVKEKYEFLIGILAFIIIISGGCYLYKHPVNALKTTNNAQTNDLAQTITKHDVPFTTTTSDLTSFSVDGTGTFSGPDSAVRVILLGYSKGKQVNYLVYNNFNLTGGSTTFSFNSSAIETSILPDVQPIGLRWETADGSTVQITKQHINEQATRALVPAIKAQDLKPVGGGILGLALSATKVDYTNKTASAINDVMNKVVPAVASSRATSTTSSTSVAGFTAGRTSLTDLTYQQLIDSTGGDPTLSSTSNAFMYYDGGIFPVSNDWAKDWNLGFKNSYSVSTTSTLPKTFDWRNWDGANFITPVKDQGNLCSSCWAFASIASIEAITNIQFNEPIARDLSEQQMIGSFSFREFGITWASACKGGFSNNVYNYAMGNDVLTEAEDPNTGVGGDNKSSVTDPANHIRISGGSSYPGQVSADTLIKLLIQRGPITVYVKPQINHFLSIVGYELDASNNVIWHVKNSWGTDWGGTGSNAGFANLVLNDQAVLEFRFATEPYYPRDLSHQATCTDRDGDGYYFWGLGSKPSTCPAGSPILEDANDGDSSMYSFPDSSGLNIPVIPNPAPAIYGYTVNGNNVTRGKLTAPISTLTIGFTTNIPDQISVGITVTSGSGSSLKTLFTSSTTSAPAIVRSNRTVDFKLATPLAGGTYGVTLVLQANNKVTSKTFSVGVTQPRRSTNR